MAHLRVPQLVANAPCFQSLEPGEVALLLFVLAARYRQVVLGGATYERTVTALAHGVAYFAPPLPLQSTNGTGTIFDVLVFTQARWLVEVSIFVSRNLAQDPIHDILDIMRLRWSSGPQDTFAVKALAEPEKLHHAANPTMRTGLVSPMTLAVPDVQGPVLQSSSTIAPGFDLSNLNNKAGLQGRLTETLLIDPDTPLAATINLYLATPTPQGGIRQAFRDHVAQRFP